MGQEREKATNKGHVTKPATTVGDWHSASLGKLWYQVSKTLSQSYPM